MILEIDDTNVFCYLALGPWYYIIKFWGAVPYTRHRLNGEYVYKVQQMVFSNMIGPAGIV